ncbi:peptide deformylase protein [Rhizobium phage RHph_I1_18]|nr:peptide deformylase protein [Rhizobium phage RHph_I1_18]
MTDINVSTPLFTSHKSTSVPVTAINYETLMDMVLPIRIGSDFISRKAPATYDFSMHAAHEPIILSNKLVLDVYEGGHFGLAAPQVGIDYRVIAVAGFDSALFNPTIVDVGGLPTALEEISPSFPTTKVKITRAPHVEIRYLDAHGKFNKKIFTGMTARILQQLIEILEGKSILDHTSDFKKSKILAKTDKLLK